MLELWKNLFAVAPFIPHGHCYLWKPGLVGLHIASDSLIAVAYYSIPITLLYFVRKRQDLLYPWIFLLFSTFIVACGTTHLMEIWTLWHPTYWLSGCLKAITAFVSLVTAIELMPLIPKLLALPSPALLEAANRELEQEIRERTKIQAALQEREQSLRQIYDSVSEVIWVVEQLEDGEFQTVSMNRAIEAFGLSADSWVGKRLDELWDCETAATIRARYCECLQQDKSISYEENLPFGGQIRWFLTTLTPLSDPDSRTRLLGASMDISDRKRAEAALRESEARFQAFMNASPTAAWITDKDGLLLYFNQTYSRIFDLPTDLAGKINLTSIYPSEFAQDYLKNICKVVETDRTLEAIELAPLEDGSLGEFLVYKFPLTSLSGEVLVGGVAIDITESKKAEAALQQREQEFRALVENAPDIIMRLDRECRYLYINPTVERQSGIPPATFIGKTIKELGANEALVNLWRTAIEQVFETGCEQNIEYEIPSVAGLTYYASRIVPEFGSDSSVQSVLAIARDISERKVAEAALEKARDELEIRVKERTALLVTANKELGQEISERKQAQAALQASESRLKELLDNTAAFISSARIHPDRVWEYNYYSPNGEALFGYKGEEFAADPSLWLSRIPAEDIETIFLPAMADLYAGHQITIEYRFQHKNGNVRWLSNTLLAKKLEFEDVWFATGIVIDITERKQAEKALQESEQRFATLAKTAPVGIYRNDTQGYCVYGNERCLQMTGLSLEELIREGWATAIHPDDRDRVITAWYSFVQQGIPYSYEFRLQRRDGSIIWVLAQAIAETNLDGNTIGYIGTITDITERKQSEQLLKEYNQILENQVQQRTVALTQINAQLEQEIEERKQIEDQLRRSEAKLSAILDNAGACIYIKDLNGTYTYVNRLTEEFFGCSEAEIIGADDCKFFAEELAVTYKENNALVTNSGLVHRFEEVGIDRDGELHYFLSTKVPLKNSDGDVYAMCGISTDITELKKTETALRQSEERMQALLSAIPDLMFRHRVDGTYLDVAGNGSSLLVPREMLIGRKLQDTPIPEQVKADLLERFQAVATTGTLQIYEHDLEKPDGIHSYETRIVKSGTDEIVCLVRDITERKRSQAALQESEERYRTVIAAMAEGIVLQDTDGTIRTCNASAKRILGLSRKQMIGRTSLDPAWRAVREDGSHFPGEEHPAMVTLRTGKACSNVVMGVHKPDGSFTWISINSQPLCRAGEPLPHAVVCSFADITARKRTEEALRQSESILRSFFDSGSMMMGIIELYDNDIRHLSDNLLAAQFFGKTPEQTKNRFASEMGVLPAHIQQWSERYREALDTQAAVRFEYLHQTPTEQKWLSASVCPIGIGPNGRPRLSYIVEDITNRKRAQEALRLSEARLQHLTASIPGTLYSFGYYPDGSAKFEYVSPGCRDIFEFEPEQILEDRNLLENQVSPDDRLRFEEAISYSLQNLQSLTAEWRSIAPSGKQKWLRAQAQLEDREDGSKVWHGVILDISDRKQMEQALQQSNERFQLAASALKGFIYDWDFQQNTVLRTQGLFDAVGYRPEEAEAKFEWWNEHVHPEDLPNVSQQLAEAFSNPNQIYYAIEYRLRHRNGHYVYLSDYGAIARDASGRAIRAVGHAIDVSERRKAEAALQKALQAAQAASIAKSRFLSNMSHELRTPLNAILGFSQVMVRSSSLSSDHKEQLKIINRSGEHLLNLINDILSMAKIEAGQTTLNENRFDLYQLLDDLEKMLKLKATSKGLQLIFERSSDLPQYVQSDENKLRQVLINMLGNSIKFTADGQVILRVKKGWVSKKDSSLNIVPKTPLLFEVEDTGPGISPNEIETLFDPFVQTESGRQSMQGTGLGLPISRQFVQMMGGDITVSSQLGQGAIFRFNIFALEVAEADEKVAPTTLQVIGLEPNQPVYRILVVEDVQENRQLLSQLLEPLGFEVRAAVNGREAIALWSTWKPHLILMDMRMPVMDGYEATKEIKMLEQRSAVAKENHSSPADSSPTNTTKIIALTASAFDEDRAKIMAAGCDDFIHKPFRESILFDKMVQHLGVRYIYQEDLPPSLPQSATFRKLTPEDLKVMPSEWIAQFQEVVLCADDELMLQLIEQIPESEASLAQTLTDLVNNFRLDILFNLVKGSTNE